MIKQNKAQVIIITLWIMIILGILAISVANRVSLGLRLSRYARDGLKADALAMAGVNRAVIEIANDAEPYYPSNAYWEGGETKFKEIKIDDNNYNEVFSVAYVKAEANGNSSLAYGISDEDSKININAADEELLKILLEEFNIANAASLARNIVAWCGDPNAVIPAEDLSWDYTDKGYPCKKKPLANVEELLLVKDMTADTYNSIKNYITTHADLTNINININTASPEVIHVLLKYSVAQWNNSGGSIDMNIADSLLAMIENFLKSESFTQSGDLVSQLSQYIGTGPSSSDYIDVLNQLGPYTQVASQYYRIISTGIVKKPLLARSIECIYDKNTGAIISWHQN